MNANPAAPADRPMLDTLRARRYAVGPSADELAERAFCSKSTIYLTERGYQPARNTARRIDAALRQLEDPGA